MSQPGYPSLNNGVLAIPPTPAAPHPDRGAGEAQQGAQPPPPFLSICAPAYNEEEAIERVVGEWVEHIERDGLDAEIVIANDGSTDRTGTILARLAQELPSLRVLAHERNGGYGRAMRAAMVASRGAYILTMDSDGQSDLADWRALYETMQAQGLDAITGYRHAKQATLVHVYGDRALNLLVRGLFGLRLRDTNCSLKLFRGEVGREVAAIGEAMGYAAPTEFLVKAQLLGYRVGEARTTHLARAGGASKLKALHTSLAMGQFLLYLRWKQTLYQQRIISRM